MLETKDVKNKSHSNIYILETTRLLRQKSWLLIVPIMFMLTYIVCDYMSAMEYNLKTHVNIWDGIYGVYYNYFDFMVIILFFSIIIMNSLLNDIDSSWMQLSMTRCSSPVQWWKAKVFSIFVTSFFYVILCIAIIVITASIFLPFDIQYSDLVMRKFQMDIITNANLDIPTNISPPVFLLQYTLYTIFSLGIYTMIPVTLALVMRNRLSMLIPICWPLMSYYLESNLTFYRIDIIPKLSYGVHFLSDKVSSLSLTTSIIYLILVGILMYSWGAYAIRHQDF